MISKNLSSLGRIWTLSESKDHTHVSKITREDAGVILLNEDAGNKCLIITV